MLRPRRVPSPLSFQRYVLTVVFTRGFVCRCRVGVLHSTVGVVEFTSSTCSPFPLPFHPQKKSARFGRLASTGRDPPRHANTARMGLTVWARELCQAWGLSAKDDRYARPDTCVFCAKFANADSSSFLYEDAELVVFRDWKPAATQHVLVIPKKHISSARALTGTEDAGLAKRMLDLGRRVIGENAAAETSDKKENNNSDAGDVKTRFGFHLPPFNSVDHLHMHAFQLPFVPGWKERKYSVDSWARFAFEPAGETVGRLQREAAREDTKTNSKL